MNPDHTKDNYVGNKYNMLTCLGFSHNVRGEGNYYRFRCDCGNVVLLPITLVKRGRKYSCGCTRKKRNNDVYKGLNLKHGMSDTHLYKIYTGMKDRCLNPKSKYYRRYGGRGITVCEEWKKDSSSFFRWALSNGYKEGLSLDRINNDGNYEPGNCRWATRTQQMNNTRTNKYMTHDGVTMTMKQWSIELGIPYSVLKNRSKAGWSDEDMLTIPILPTGTRLKKYKQRIKEGGDEGEHENIG